MPGGPAAALAPLSALQTLGRAPTLAHPAYNKHQNPVLAQPTGGPTCGRRVLRGAQAKRGVGCLCVEGAGGAAAAVACATRLAVAAHQEQHVRLEGYGYRDDDALRLPALRGHAACQDGSLQSKTCDPAATANGHTRLGLVHWQGIALHWPLGAQAEEQHRQLRPRLVKQRLLEAQFVYQARQVAPGTPPLRLELLRHPTSPRLSSALSKHRLLGCPPGRTRRADI